MTNLMLSVLFLWTVQTNEIIGQPSEQYLMSYPVQVVTSRERRITVTSNYFASFTFDGQRYEVLIKSLPVSHQVIREQKQFMWVLP